MPLTPRRIVSLSAAATDSLVALGIRPVLVEGSLKTTACAVSRRSPPRRADDAAWRRAQPRSRVGRQARLDFRGQHQDGKLYGQFSKIAPTVTIASAATATAKIASWTSATWWGCRNRPDSGWPSIANDLQPSQRNAGGKGQRATGRLSAVPSQYVCHLHPDGHVRPVVVRATWAYARPGHADGHVERRMGRSFRRTPVDASRRAHFHGGRRGQRSVSQGRGQNADMARHPGRETRSCPSGGLGDMDWRRRPLGVRGDRQRRARRDGPRAEAMMRSQ